MMVSDPIEDVIADVAAGRPIVIVDDSDRENEGDIFIAAEKISSEQIAFMMEESKGLICLSLTDERLRHLGISMQVVDNTSHFGTNFTVSIDHKSVGPYGVTASSRAATILAAVDDSAESADFLSPGYVFPLRAVPGGVLRRRGQTEASVDFARIAGLKPAGVICEIMDTQGKMLRGDALMAFCTRHEMKLTSVEDLVRYRLQREICLRRAADNAIEDISTLRLFTGDRSEHVCAGDGQNSTLSGPLRLIVYVDDVDNKEHLCLLKGDPKDGMLCRIHSECLTGDVFDSLRCDCGSQFRQALRSILKEDSGAIIYLYQEGRGIGLGNKLRAYELQDKGFDTVDANIELGFAPDLRNYRVAAQILADLGVKSIRLMTNNPSKVSALPEFGIDVSERVPMVGNYNEHNVRYLMAKQTRLGHIMPDLKEQDP